MRMAEALGILATVAGLITAAIDVSKTLSDLYNTFKDTPDLIKELERDVIALSSVLKKIHSKAEEASPTSAICQGLGEESFKVTVLSCENDLRRLRAILSKLTPKKSKIYTVRLRSTVKWLYLESSIESVKKALEAHKSALNLVLSLDIEKNTRSIPEIQESTRKTLQLLEVLVERVGAKVEKESHARFEQAVRRLDQSDAGVESTIEVLHELSLLSSARTEQTSNMPIEEAQMKSEARTESEESHACSAEEPLNPLQSEQDDVHMVNLPKSMVPKEEESESTTQQTAPIQDPQLVAALCTAAMRGATDVIELLLGTGVDINAYDEDCTALWQAIHWWKGDAVGLLLAKGADPNLRTKEQSISPLKEAVSKREHSMVRMLLGRGADAKEPGLLHGGVLGLDEEMLSLLINAGADVNGMFEGHTVISSALWWNQAGIVDALLKVGVDPKLTGKGQTPSILDAACRGMADVVQMFLYSGVDVNALYDGETALSAAINLERTSVVEVLLNAGADPTLAGKGKQSPVVQAASKGRADIVQMLLARR